MLVPMVTVDKFIKQVSVWELNKILEKQRLSQSLIDEVDWFIILTNIGRINGDETTKFKPASLNLSDFYLMKKN